MNCLGGHATGVGRGTGETRRTARAAGALATVADRRSVRVAAGGASLARLELARIGTRTLVALTLASQALARVRTCTADGVARGAAPLVLVGRVRAEDRKARLAAAAVHVAFIGDLCTGSTEEE
jgi:hypothetical protein